MHFEHLNTTRLKLRMVTPEVYKFVFTHFEDQTLMTFFGVETDEELKRERTKYEKGMTTYNRSFLLFHLIDKSTDRVIGACGLHNWFAEHSRSEIGYHLLHDENKQKGFMSEAIERIIDYGFDELKLNRIEAFIGTKNIASQKLIRKMNFTQEGLLREHYCKNTIPEDSMVFSLLKSEYKKRPVL